MLRPLRITGEVFLKKIWEEEQLEHKKNYKELYTYDLPKGLAQAHGPRTLDVEIFNTNENGLPLLALAFFSCPDHFLRSFT